MWQIIDCSSRWTNGEVRRLLQRLRKPNVLAVEPLAQSLCAHFGVDRPFDAVALLLEETFKDQGIVAQRLHELIRTCDLEGVPHETYADQHHYSARQFYRHRRAAIEAIAARVNASVLRPATSDEDVSYVIARTLAGVDPAGSSTLYARVPHTLDADAVAAIDGNLSAERPFDETLFSCIRGPERKRALLIIAQHLYRRGRTEVADQLVESVRSTLSRTSTEERPLVAFDLAYAEYIRAAQHSDTETIADAGRRLRAAASDDRQRIIALALESSAALRRGDIDMARDSLQLGRRIARDGASHHVYGLGLLAMVHARMAFMEHDLAEADRFADAALAALKNFRIHVPVLHALVGSMRLAMGKPWRPPADEAHAGDDDFALSIDPRSEPIVLPASNRDSIGTLQLALVEARAMMYADRATAVAIANDVLSRATALRYPVVIAQALALRGALHALAGDTAAAQDDNVAAWRAFLTVRDMTVGHDLFFNAVAQAREFGVVDLDDSFLDALCVEIELSVPRWPLARLGLPQPELRSFWRTLLLHAYGEGPRPQLRTPSSVTTDHAAVVHPAMLRHEKERVIELWRALAVLLPTPVRERFIARLKQSAAELNERAQLLSDSACPIVTIGA